MANGFDLRCAAGKTPRLWLQGKGGKVVLGQAMVLLHPKKGQTLPVQPGMPKYSRGRPAVSVIPIVTAFVGIPKKSQDGEGKPAEKGATIHHLGIRTLIRRHIRDISHASRRCALRRAASRSAP
jgi:hypothetical protein